MDLNRLLALSGLRPSAFEPVGIEALTEGDFRSYLMEAQDYAAIYSPILKAFRAIYQNPNEHEQRMLLQFQEQLAGDVEWAKRHMKRADAIIWFLRWDRFFMARSYAGWDEFFRGKDKTPIEEIYASIAADMQRRGGIENPMAVARPQNFKGDLEHLMSLPIRGIQAFRFGWQTPEAVIESFKTAEEAASAKVEDSAPWRMIDPDNIWRTDDRANMRRSVIPQAADYHAKEKVLMTFPDGTFWLLLNRAYCAKEADSMVHCGNSPRQNTDDNIVSLRRFVDKATGLPVTNGTDGVWQWLDPEEAPEGKKPGVVWQRPELTFILYGDGHLGEMKGLKNNTPGKRFHDHIVALMRSPVVTGVIGDGYLPQKNFHLAHLSPEKRAALLNDKPELNRYWLPPEAVKVLHSVPDGPAGWMWGKVADDRTTQRRLKWDDNSTQPPSLRDADQWLSLGLWHELPDGRRMWEHHVSAILTRGEATQQQTLTTMIGRVAGQDLSEFFNPIHGLLQTDAVVKVQNLYTGSNLTALVKLYQKFPEYIRQVEDKLYPLIEALGAQHFSPAIYPKLDAKILAKGPVEPTLVPLEKRVEYWRKRLFDVKNATAKDVPEEYRSEAYGWAGASALSDIAKSPEDMEALPVEGRKTVYTVRAMRGEIRYTELPEEFRSAENVALAFAAYPDDIHDYPEAITEKIASKIVTHHPGAFKNLPEQFRATASVMQALLIHLTDSQHRGNPSRYTESIEGIRSIPANEWPQSIKDALPKMWEKLIGSDWRAQLVAHISDDLPLLKAVLDVQASHDRYYTSFRAIEAKYQGQMPDALLRMFANYGVVPIKNLPPDLLTHETILARILGHRQKSKWGYETGERSGGNSGEANDVPVDRWTPQLAVVIAKDIGVTTQDDMRSMQSTWRFPEALRNREYLTHFLKEFIYPENKAKRAIRLLFGTLADIWTPDLVVSAIRRGIVEPKIASIGADQPAIMLGPGTPYPVDEKIAPHMLRADPLLVTQKDLPPIFTKAKVLATAATLNPKVLHYLPKKFLSSTVVQSAMGHHATSATPGSFADNQNRLHSLLKSLPKEKWGEKGWHGAVLSRMATLADVPEQFRKAENDLHAVRSNPLNLSHLPDPAAWAKSHADRMGDLVKDSGMFLARGGVIHHHGEYKNVSELPKQELGETGWSVARFDRARNAPEFFFFDPAGKHRLTIFVNPKKKSLVVVDKGAMEGAKTALRAWIPTIDYDLGDVQDSGFSFNRRDNELTDLSQETSRYGYTGWGRSDSKLVSFTNRTGEGGSIVTYRKRESKEPVLRVFKNRHNNIEHVEVLDWQEALEANDEISEAYRQGGSSFLRLGWVTTGMGSWSDRNRKTYNVRKEKVGEVGVYSVWRSDKRIGLFGPTGMIAHAIMKKLKKGEPAIRDFETVWGFDELAEPAERALERASRRIQGQAELPLDTEVPARVRESR